MPQALFYKKCWLSPDLNPHSHSDIEVFCGWEWLLAGRTMTAGDMFGMYDLWDTLYSSLGGSTVVKSKAHFLNQKVEEREPT